MLVVPLLASSAHAWIYVGSPDVSAVVDRPSHDLVAGWTTLDKVRMHACSGGYTDVAVGQSLDPTKAFTVAVPPGDWCGVSFVWGAAVATTNGDWLLAYDEPYTSIELDGHDTVSKGLTPYTVVSGTMSGLAPRLYVTVE